MNNHYAELFKKITPQQWKDICDQCLTSSNLEKFFNTPLPKRVISYYSKKFNYRCPLDDHTKDERGNRYGHLTVIDFAGRDSRGYVLWTCKCDCGNIEVRSGRILRAEAKNGMCKECCKKNLSLIHQRDLTGQTINELFIEKRVGENKYSGLILYQCKCLHCNNTIIVDSGKLRGPHAQISCGCINSFGEYKLNKILQELNIQYKTQYSFSDCKYKLPLKFDFALFDNEELKCLIEFQGIQHYQQIGKYWNDSLEKLKIRQLRDNIKREYCKNNSIPLIEISYKERNKLSVQYLKEKLKNIFFFD